MQKSTKLVVGLLVAVAYRGAMAKDILGSLWVGEPKTYVNGRLTCSPDPADNPERRPSQPVKGYPFLTPYLYIKKVGSTGFRIFENDNCGGIFGFDGGHTRDGLGHRDVNLLTEGYFFYHKDGKVFSRTGTEVGTIASDRIEIFEGKAHSTDFEYLLMEIKPDGTLGFYSDFRISGYVTPNHPHGSRFEHAAIYSPRDHN